MNKLDYLLSINPNFLSLKTQEIICHEEILGYHCYAVENPQFTFSGGTSSSLDTAKRIAIAEAFERSFLSLIAKSENYRKQFLIEDNPSSSGFAAGFEEKSTRFRALCEGLECWAWSKWIDECYKMPLISKPKGLNKLTQFLLTPFQNTYWFSKSFEVFYDNEMINLKFVVFIGTTDEGVFSGSRVSTPNDNLWEHPVIEAYRNYKNFLLYQKEEYELQDIIQQRVIFFAKNKQIAFDQINRATKDSWPKPEINLIKDFKTEHPDIFLTRCLMSNFLGWHHGTITRFIY